MLIEELEAHGFNVIEAADADEALSVLRESRRIDLLFTDIKVPGTLDGFELTRLAHAERPGLKVVIASAHVGLSCCWTTEADAGFEKPFEFMGGMPQRCIPGPGAVFQPRGVRQENRSAKERKQRRLFNTDELKHFLPISGLGRRQEIQPNPPLKDERHERDHYEPHNTQDSKA